MARIIVGFLCIASAFCDVNQTDSRLVWINQGPVRGYKSHDYNIYVFYGVPYAAAPSGEKKFMGPLSPSNWSEPLEAIDKSIICPQVASTIFADYTMQEDCLLANIYVPEKIVKKVPVVIYVHGGAYVIGYGDLSTPKNLVNSQKVIAVTFNYRLGAHGFLCLGTQDIPGNSGIKDQVALLRWVKSNIAQFGGNPKDVTISGYSAGASSVDLLMISKTTRGLFNKVIPESGANLAAFSIQRDPLENAKSYARLLNFTNVDDIDDLERFYKRASYEQLTSISSQILNRSDSTFLFSPCIQGYSENEVFLDDDPVNILKRGNYPKLPILYGFANMEGLFRINLFNTWKDQMNQNFANFLPADLQFQSDEERQELANKIKNFYFGNKRISEETVLAYVDYFTDVIFAYPALRSLKLQVGAGNHNVYLYEYSFVDDDTPFVPYTNVRGAEHCAQTAAVLDGVNKTHMDENLISKEYRKIKITMRELWLNFITTGKPVLNGSPLPEWSPAGVDGSPYLSLNQTSQLKSCPLLHRRIKFWEEIYSKHYRRPMPPAPHDKNCK